MTTWLAMWFTSVAISVAWVSYDLLLRTPAMKVMKWGWIMVTLYLGPFAFLVYWYSCREPRPGSHEEFVAPLWKQAVGSTIHCLAGDATGIIGAAALTSALGLAMGADLIVEYVVGFSFGLLIFQALFMKDMLGGGYLFAVRKTVLAEFISMNAVMAGMVPVMVFFMTHDMRAMEPRNPEFWAYMSIAALAGAILGFPFNWWLVKNNLKHGMGTERALGKGGAPKEQSKTCLTHIPVRSHTSASGGSSHAANATPMHGRPAFAASKLVVAVFSLILLASGAWLASRYANLSLRLQHRINK